MRRLVILISGIFCAALSYSQNGNANSSSSEAGIANAISLYDHFTGSNAPLYNGKEYVFYTFSMRGDPFFVSAKFSPGWISYEGKKYDSVKLLYDLTRNELVLLGADKRSAIVLLNASVDSFGFSGNKFINLQKDEETHLEYAGFYNLLYDGRIQILAQRKKTISEVIEDYTVIRVFLSADHFYIHKNDSYYSVNNSKDVFRVLSDKRKQLKKRMRQEHIKIKKKEFENSLVKVAQFYDEIRK